jgi:hypothetical protein
VLQIDERRGAAERERVELDEGAGRLADGGDCRDGRERGGEKCDIEERREEGARSGEG